jgi:hypothetical protein
MWQLEHIYADKAWFNQVAGRKSQGRSQTRYRYANASEEGGFKSPASIKPQVLWRGRNPPYITYLR